jgi:hypothetical protein
MLITILQKITIKLTQKKISYPNLKENGVDILKSMEKTIGDKERMNYQI